MSVLLGTNPISWKTKKQTIVSRSTVEAEYRAMTTLTSKLQWLKYPLDDLGLHKPHDFISKCVYSCV